MGKNNYDAKRRLSAQDAGRTWPSQGARRRGKASVQPRLDGNAFAQIADPCTGCHWSSSEPGHTGLDVLIDADNASASVIKELLEEIAKYGGATVKRFYFDWTD